MLYIYLVHFIFLLTHKYIKYGFDMKLLDLFERKADDFNIDAFHGTHNSFKKFDPNLTGDIGIHFGSKKAANDIVNPIFKPTNGDPYKPGANIIPVKLRLKNPLRVKDMFSTLRTTYLNRAKQWVHNTPGFHPNTEDRNNIYDAAKEADKARRKAGGEWGALNKSKDKDQEIFKQSEKRFWQAIQTACEHQGYDGLVYSNKIEGNGDDSYIVFHPKNIRFKFS